MNEIDWTHELTEQIDRHWRTQLRPRLDGLTDAEYRWEPTPHAWNVHPRGAGIATAGGGGQFTIDFALPVPEPPPFTTIAWRLGHVIVGVLAMRNASHFGAPPADYQTWEYAGTADGALDQLDREYDTWLSGVRALGAEGLGRPCGPSEPFPEMPMAALVLHIHRELIHHGAEICLLRDLHLHLHTGTDTDTDTDREDS